MTLVQKRVKAHPDAKLVFLKKICQIELLIKIHSISALMPYERTRYWLGENGITIKITILITRDVVW